MTKLVLAPVDKGTHAYISMKGAAVSRAIHIAAGSASQLQEPTRHNDRISSTATPSPVFSTSDPVKHSTIRLTFYCRHNIRTCVMYAIQVETKQDDRFHIYAIIKIKKCHKYAST